MNLRFGKISVKAECFIRISDINLKNTTSVMDQKTKEGVLSDRVSINQRPDVINNRERKGDWESDLIIGHGHKGAILTIVERQTAYLVMAKTNGKKAESVKKQLINALAPYKEHVHSITNDNGKEFALHKEFGNKLQANIYFCNPYASYERGLNEYTNKLIRQYLPKSTNLNDVTHKQINEVQRLINARPREKLDFHTPAEIFFQQVQQTE